MGYADDILLMDRTKENLRNDFGKLEKSAKEKDLLINDSKTKVIRIGKTTETQNGKIRLRALRLS